jgi:hypothetical protein
MGKVRPQDVILSLLGTALFSLLLRIAGLVVRVWLLGAILVSILSGGRIPPFRPKADKERVEKRTLQEVVLSFMKTAS